MTDFNVSTKQIIVTKGKEPKDGESAYQIAFRNGFVGTEQEWLRSLYPDMSRFVADEIPSGLVNGINATFTAEYDFIPESVVVKLNGIAQKKVIEYNTTGNRTIIFLVSPTSSDYVTIDYIKL